MENSGTLLTELNHSFIILEKVFVRSRNVMRIAGCYGLG
jgi:hypothetical protein